MPNPWGIVWVLVDFLEGDVVHDCNLAQLTAIALFPPHRIPYTCYAMDTISHGPNIQRYIASPWHSCDWIDWGHPNRLATYKIHSLPQLYITSNSLHLPPDWNLKTHSLPKMTWKKPNNPSESIKQNAQQTFTKIHCLVALVVEDLLVSQRWYDVAPRNARMP